MYRLSALNQYQNVDLESRIATASPHMLISMLLDGALKKIALAKGAANRGDIAQRGMCISSAINIVDGLRSSLDLKVGGEIASNLEELYSYMERRLAEANRKSDQDIMTEVGELLYEIKTGWDNMPVASRRM
ncbi:MAG TPA: flagellar export chaperone FliS [Candidatus Acidoferrum sp.]|nr:flagellar export chaperone FliS [Candidatus Acidoferrum sp.]